MCARAEKVPGKREVIHALETEPDCLWAGRILAIGVIHITAQLCDQRQEFSQLGSPAGRFLSSNSHQTLFHSAGSKIASQARSGAQRARRQTIKVRQATMRYTATQGSIRSMCSNRRSSTRQPHLRMRTDRPRERMCSCFTRANASCLETPRKVEAVERGTDLARSPAAAFLMVIGDSISGSKRAKPLTISSATANNID
jgi:hypothetical protein